MVSARFQEDGFEVIRNLIDAAELEKLRAAYDYLLANGSDGDRLLGGLTRQIMVPEHAMEAFAENRALDAGCEFARRVCGWKNPKRTFSMLIFKPAGHPHPTPWHQDISYFERPFAREGFPVTRQTLQFWVAMDEADRDNGCMHFVARNFDQSLAHHIASGKPEDEGRLLAINDESIVTEDNVFACEISAGDATVHHEGTLHYTPPNVSDRPRRAYIFNIADGGIRV
jgi:ectoine hydroxylase-related dioxygenase (phytanoyl-CoA dioxygenase family)